MEKPIKHLKGNKCTGADGITGKMIKAGERDWLEKSMLCAIKYGHMGTRGVDENLIGNNTRKG